MSEIQIHTCRGDRHLLQLSQNTTTKNIVPIDRKQQ
jgi:hypothetical protein